MWNDRIVIWSGPGSTSKSPGKLARPLASRIPIASMPVDGLQVGADEGGAVGPYEAPNRFDGTIESVTIGLDATR